MTTSLLHRPIPYKDESPGSILLRVTEYNGWKSPSSLLIAQDYKYSKNATLNIESLFCDKDKWDDACFSLGLSQDLFHNIFYSRIGRTLRSDIDFMGILMPWKKLRLKKPAFCPICISEKKYHKKTWDLRLVTTCSEHKVRLVDQCPKCKSKISWNRRLIAFCSCGHSLESIPTKTINTKTTEYIEQLIKHKNRDKLLLLLSVQSTYEAFYNFLGISFDDHELASLSVATVKAPDTTEKAIKEKLDTAGQIQGIHPRLAMYPFLSSDKFEIRSLANSILKNYQYKQSLLQPIKLEGKINFTSTAYVLGISSHLTKILINHKLIKRNKKKANGSSPIEVTLDSLNNFLHLLSDSTSMQVSNQNLETIKNLSKTFKYCHNFITLMKQLTSGEREYSGIKVTADGIKGVLIKPFAREKPIVAINYITIKETAKLCAVHYENIRFAINSEILKRIPSGETKGTTIFINKDDALEFNRRYVFSGCIANEHNCNPTNIAEKIFATGVKAVSGPGIDGGLVYLFKRVEINALDIKKVNKIKNYPTKTGRKKGDNISLDEDSLSLSKVADLLNISIPKATLLLSNGFLIELPTHFRAKRVTKESLKRVIDMRNNTSYISISSASKSINESVQKFRRRWLRTGFIDSVNTGLDSYILPEDLERIKTFKRQYITAKEAIKSTCIGELYFKDYILPKVIKITKQLGEDRNRVTFYDKDEIICACKRDT